MGTNLETVYSCRTCFGATQKRMNMEVWTVDFLSQVKAKAKADKKVIVLPESYEKRNLEAAAEHMPPAIISDTAESGTVNEMPLPTR